jgi:hypothetical protein
MPKNPLFINHKVWESYTESELEDYTNNVFEYYKCNGFPYFELTETQIKSVYSKMKELDTSTLLQPDNKLKQIMIGLNLVNYYMPHMWSVKCNKFSSPMETFTNDEMLMKAVKKRINLGDNMSDAGMRKSLSWTHGTHRVSNFRPSIAKYFYENYSNNGDVLDFSSGFGGRLLGAMVSNIKSYTGTDPSTKTFKGLEKMVEELSLDTTPEIILYNKPFEDLDLDLDLEYDLAFSSPPYFNTEEYSYEDTQSFIRYNSVESWRDNFLKVIIDKNYKLIKKGGYFIINVANVSNYKDLEKDTMELALLCGFKYIKTYKMSLSSLMKGGFKYEPIFVFQK